jgi:2-hydroxychromene-2-carboxylate isomerase
MKRTSVEVYFSFRSPYSWIAAHVLARHGIDPASPDVEHIPVWEPDSEFAQRLAAVRVISPYSPMSHAKHLYILGDIKRVAARHGLSVRWPVDVKPEWDIPHRAWLALDSRADRAAFFHSVYRARWEEGRNIWAWETMNALLSELGFDATALIDMARSDTGVVEARAIEAHRAVYKHDVFGVPYFRNGRESYWGIDRINHFLDDFGAAEGYGPLAGIPAEVIAATGAYDCDHSGGCG